LGFDGLTCFARGIMIISESSYHAPTVVGFSASGAPMSNYCLNHFGTTRKGPKRGLLQTRTRTGVPHRVHVDLPSRNCRDCLPGSRWTTAPPPE
jgi:hypothetical protein